MDLKPGQILAGKYRIERVLGQGGMGVVVAATHLQLDELVALKFLLPEASRSPEAVARFAREARAAVKIKSEHVAVVTDVGALENGSPYMVMEYLKGEDLSARVREQGPLAIPEAIELVLQACEALAEAHSLGIVHRDLKPANLFLIRRRDGSPCLKILDFGISKMTGAAGSSAPDYGMTKTTAVMGSPQYMSPEQLNSARDVDARTDIWAMGVVLYELLCGRTPFDAESLGQLVGTILVAPPRSLLAQRADVPPALERVIFHCLQKDRVYRFSNVEEFAQALLPFAPNSAARSVDRVSRILSSGVSQPVEVDPSLSVEAVRAATYRDNTSGGGNIPSTHASWGQTLPRKSRHSVWVIVAALTLPVVAGGVLFAMHHSAPMQKKSAASASAASPSVSTTIAISASVVEPPSAPSSLVALATSTSSQRPTALRPNVPPPVRPPGDGKPIGVPTSPRANGCDPAFTFDEQGRRHFKPECFVNQGSKP